MKTAASVQLLKQELDHYYSHFDPCAEKLLPGLAACVSAQPQDDSFARKTAQIEYMAQACPVHLFRHTPLFFSQNGIMQCLHSFRFRRVEYFRYTTQFDFSFEADGSKMLIVNPEPKELYAGSTSFYREIDTGESIGAYKVFTATGFLGALSRNVLDR